MPEWLKLKFGHSDEKVSSKNHYLLLAGLAGAAIMIFSNFYATEKETENVNSAFLQASNQAKETAVFGDSGDSQEPNTMMEYEELYETQLRDALEQVVGVGNASIMVNLDATSIKIYEKNRVTQSQNTDEVDREGGKRKVEDLSLDEKVVIVRNGEEEKPVLVKTEKPAIRGVLVVAEGADNVQVKKWIVEAVTRVLDVPAHRVSVLPKKNQGE